MPKLGPQTGYGLFFSTIKMLLMLTIVLLLPVQLKAQLKAHASQPLTSVGFTWSSTNSATNGWPNCSATVTTICVSGYTLSDITVPATPVVISASISATSISYTLTPLPTPVNGSIVHTYSLVTDGVGATAGSTANSTPATASVSVPSSTPNPPAGFAATP